MQLLNHLKQHKTLYTIGIILALFVGSAVYYSRNSELSFLVGELGGNITKTRGEIVSPKVGQVVHQGQSLQIEWRFGNKDLSKASTRVYLLPNRRVNNSANQQNQLLVQNHAGNTYRWTIPNETLGEYRFAAVTNGMGFAVMRGFLTIEERVSVAAIVEGEWDCPEFELTECPASGQRSRTCTRVDVQTCEPVADLPACTASDWTCSDFAEGQCNAEGNEVRTCALSASANCNVGPTADAGRPELERLCTCGDNDWNCTEFSACLNGEQARSCSTPDSCAVRNSTPPSPAVSQNCAVEQGQAQISKLLGLSTTMINGENRLIGFNVTATGGNVSLQNLQFNLNKSDSFEIFQYRFYRGSTLLQNVDISSSGNQVTVQFQQPEVLLNGTTGTYLLDASVNGASVNSNLTTVLNSAVSDVEVNGLPIEHFIGEPSSPSGTSDVTNQAQINKSVGLTTTMINGENRLIGFNVTATGGNVSLQNLQFNLNKSDSFEIFQYRFYRGSMLLQNVDISSGGNQVTVQFQQPEVLLNDTTQTYYLDASVNGTSVNSNLTTVLNSAVSDVEVNGLPIEHMLSSN